MVRVQVIVEVEERELFRREAEGEGLSLSAWFRAAARERLARKQEKVRIRTGEELKSFFDDCDEREAGQGPEPDWQSHLAIIRESRGRGASGT